MIKYRSGQKLKCSPCGREVIIDDCGTSATTIWCCGKPMRSGRNSKATKKEAKKSRN
ncbi:MAG: hypothetical protein PHD29_02770 [bacterium]|nr:hypothetical protein [bacterium]MDD5756614.1 hypothetical protein [bacterium]